jgi:hypothetical protein
MVCNLWGGGGAVLARKFDTYRIFLMRCILLCKGSPRGSSKGECKTVNVLCVQFPAGSQRSKILARALKEVSTPRGIYPLYEGLTG